MYSCGSSKTKNCCLQLTTSTHRKRKGRRRELLLLWMNTIICEQWVWEYPVCLYCNRRRRRRPEARVKNSRPHQWAAQLCSAPPGVALLTFFVSHLWNVRRLTLFGGKGGKERPPKIALDPLAYVVACCPRVLRIPVILFTAAAWKNG